MANNDASIVIKAAEIIKAFCKERDDCNNCIFSSHENSCNLYDYRIPSGWEIPQRWTSDDVALAKAMKPFAAYIEWPNEEKPNPNHRYFKGPECRTIPLPTGAFASLGPGEIVTLNAIIGEKNGR